MSLKILVVLSVRFSSSRFFRLIHSCILHVPKKSHAPHFVCNHCNNESVICVYTRLLSRDQCVDRTNEGGSSKTELPCNETG